MEKFNLLSFRKLCTYILAILSFLKAALVFFMFSVQLKLYVAKSWTS